MTDPALIERIRSELSELRISEVMDRYPESRPVLYNHMGESCFGCPAATEETLAMALRFHEAVEESVYRDLAEALREKVEIMKKEETGR